MSGLLFSSSLSIYCVRLRYECFRKVLFLIENSQPNWEVGVVAHAYNHNPSTREAEAGGVTGLKPRATVDLRPA